jgi:hypothetical protein
VNKPKIGSTFSLKFISNYGDGDGFLQCVVM